MIIRPDSIAFLTDTRRQFLQSVIRVALGMLSFLFIASVLALILIQNRILPYFITGIAIFWLSTLLSLILVKKHPLGLALIPIIICIFSLLLLSSLLMPFVTPSAFALLTMLILLISITGNRQLTMIMSILSALVAALMLFLQQYALPVNFTIINRVMAIFGTASIFLTTWLISDRYTHIQQEAIQLATSRAVEAEQARAASEEARTQAEQRLKEQERLIDVIQSLELPILSMGKHILATPLVGYLDTRRMQAIQNRLLDMTLQTQAKVVILDVTGMSIIDTSVAHALIQTSEAVRLLGAKTIISGIGATVAQTLVNLDIDFTNIQTVNDMEQAILYAQQL